MKLDNIKNQTTWSDAAASINKNFGKISNAIRQGLPVINTPVDDELSDESDNAIANKAVADALKEKQDTLVSGENIKTVNGQSLLGKGNIEIQGGGAGLQYAVERTVYPTKMIDLVGSEFEGEITEEQRAYNIETYTKASEDGNVFVTFNGILLSTIFIEHSPTGYALFNFVGELDGGLISLTITISANGDAVGVQKTIQTGGSIDPELLEAYMPMAREFSDDFNNDFTR